MRPSVRASVRPCVRPSVRPFTFINLNISKTTRPIAIKFYLKHHVGGGKVALGFGPGRIRTRLYQPSLNLITN